MRQQRRIAADRNPAFALTVLLFASVAAGERSAVAQMAVAAPEWSELLHRQSGWTGADGIYSIPLSGSERIGGGGKTLLVFSDTFIGDVAADGARVPGYSLINNTLALLDAPNPRPENIQFYWPTGTGGAPEAVFTPSTPLSRPNQWYWLMDGIVLDSKLRLFSLRLRHTSGGFGFAVVGVGLLTADLGATSSDLSQIDAQHTQVDTPLFVAGSGGIGDIIFGSAILPNTAATGAPHPDGFVYIYGTRNDPFDKKLLAARVLPESFGDFAEWRYWDGTNWSTSITASAPIPGASRLSSEQSVTPLSDGRYVVVSQQDGLAPYVQVHIGLSPVGPFAAPQVIYECPEPQQDSDIICYNAKAHPHLSRPGELLISYNVNSFSFQDNVDDAGLYRPRFIRWPYQPIKPGNPTQP